MTMTIAVYRIDRESGTRTPVREKYTVEAPDVPEGLPAPPPCACARCTEGPVRLCAGVREANRRSRGAP